MEVCKYVDNSQQRPVLTGVDRGSVRVLERIQ